MQTRQQTFTAGQTVRQDGAGTFFRLLRTTGEVDIVFYRRGAEVARAEGMEAGYSENIPEGFDALLIASASGQEVKWATRQGGEIRYDRIIGNVVVDNQASANGDFSNTAKTITTTEGQVLAANASRRYLLIQNKDNTGNIYIKFGAGAATVANGLKLEPGEAYEASQYVPANEVRAIGDIASNANVLVVEG